MRNRPSKRSAVIKLLCKSSAKAEAEEEEEDEGNINPLHDYENIKKQNCSSTNKYTSKEVK